METDRQGVARSGSSRPRPFSKLRYHYYQRIPSARSKIPEIPGNFQVYGNANTMLLSIDLENHICELEYLKNLQIGGYGLVSLPEDFDRLGNSLESLDLSANNFTGVPAVLTQNNFPKLKV